MQESCPLLGGEEEVGLFIQLRKLFLKRNKTKPKFGGESGTTYATS